MLTREAMQGLYVLVITPFDDRFRLDEEGYRENVRKVVALGIDGVITTGTNGEFFVVNDEELRRLARITREECGDRVRTIVGASAVNTETSIRRSRIALEEGADGVMNVIPFYQTLSKAEAYFARPADLFARAYWLTHRLPVVITRSSNNFGPYQYPEKVIPLFVTNLIEGQQVPLYGDGRNVRDWLHVEDHCEAVLTVLEKGRSGEVYNIGGTSERSNLELTHSILKSMGKGDECIRPVKDRPGHDLRYAIDASKIKRELGWEPKRSAWPAALEATVRWYVDHPAWWRHVKSGEYRGYYAKQYGSR